MKVSFIRYEGARTAEALAEFVNSEGGTTFLVYVNSYQVDSRYII